MNLIRLCVLGCWVLLSLTASAQRDERDLKNSPPDNSYLSKGTASSGSGKSSSSSISVSAKSSTFWEISALGRGALVLGHTHQLGKGKLGLSGLIGVNIFTDFSQTMSFVFRESTLGGYSESYMPLHLIITDGKKASGEQGLYFQGALSIDFNDPSSAMEFGVRVIKNYFDVRDLPIENMYGYTGSDFSSVMVRSFMPYVAYREIEANSNSKFVSNFRVGIGLRFFKYETYEFNQDYDSNGEWQVTKQRATLPKTAGPQLALMVSVGIGKGKLR